MKTFLKNLIKTFYDAAFYRDLVTNGKGFGLGFLFVASLLGAIPLFQTASIVGLFAGKNELFENLPTITIQEGQLSMDAPSPQSYELMKEVEGGPLRVVIDLDANLKDEAALLKRMKEENLFALVSRTDIASFDALHGSIQVHSMAQAKDATYTHEDWIRLSSGLDYIMGPGMLWVLIAFGFIWQLILVFGAGFTLSLSSGWTGAPLTTEACMRLAAAARIPVMALSVVATPNATLLTAIWFGFVIFGLLAARKAKPVGNGPEIS